MDLESPVTPVTPVDRERSTFLGGPPPLLHSLSTPDVNLTTQASAARQAAAAQQQALQLQQHAQLQQAQLQAQAQAEAHARAQAQLHAEAERARAEADQRARAEEEARQQMEAEARARAEAEALAATERERAEQAVREAEQFQQMLHEDQLRLARERLHQQMQEGAAGAPQTLPNPPFAPSTPQAAQAGQVSQQPAQQQIAQTPPPQQQPQQQPALAGQQPTVPAQQPQLVFASPPQYVQLPNGGGAAPLLTLTPGNVASAGQPLFQHATSQPPAGYPAFPAGFDPGSNDPSTALQPVHVLPTYSVAGQQLPQLPIPPPLPDSVDPASISGSAASNLVSPANPGASTFASSVATSSGAGPVRPSRSRAASQSGYTSSGSRSRAASGSGYQALLENRSRAASSASSVFQPFERDDEDDEAEDGGDFEHDIDVGGGGPASLRSGQVGSATSGVDDDTRARMDPIFLDFLASICSNRTLSLPARVRRDTC